MIKTILAFLLLIASATCSVAQDTAKRDLWIVDYLRQLNFDSGMVAPNFSYKDIQGKEVTLSNFKGKIVALYFWSSDCEISVDNMADCVSKTAMVFKTFYPEDVVFINVGEEMSRRKWRKTVKKYAPEGHNIYSFLLKRKLSKQFNLNAVPRMILIGRDGIVMGVTETIYIHLLSYYLRCAIKGIPPSDAFRSFSSLIKEHDQWFFSNKLDKYQKLKTLEEYKP